MIFGCVSKKRESDLLERIQVLENQLDICQNGAEPLHARMLLEYQSSNYSECKQIYRKMSEYHAHSSLFPEVESIYSEIVAAEQAQKEQERLQAENREKEAFAQAQREKQKRERALNALNKKFDDISGITWYTNPYFVHYYQTRWTSIYFGCDGKKKWLRLRMSYSGDDWIFFEHAYLSYDGNTMEIPFNRYSDKETDNGILRSGRHGIWEWIDVGVSDQLEQFLRVLSQSDLAKRRLSGKYTKTRELTDDEMRGIRDVLNGYDALEISGTN